MSDLTVALITIFGTVASVTGVVLYVFNGTRKLIQEMHETQKRIEETQKDIKEILNRIVTLIEMVPERTAKLLEK